jgi:hypothetical protein
MNSRTKNIQRQEYLSKYKNKEYCMFWRIIILLLIQVVLINAKEFGDWTVKGTNKYRFAEQYGNQDIRTTGERYKQRLDFTFSRSKGWEMTLTTSFLAEEKDIIKLIVDDKEYIFKGQGCCHKQSFPISYEIVNKIKNTKTNIIIKEIYFDGKSYRSVFSSKGSSAALLWVSDI